MVVSVHQPQYLPWLGYFDKIKRSDVFVYLDKVQYKHREFQNRNRIRTERGWIWLTVPVMTKGHREQSISDVRIDNSIDWAKNHLRSLDVWYGKAPGFRRHMPFFRDTYFGNKWDSLSKLNVHITGYILKEFGITTPVMFESELDITTTSTDRIIEICGRLKADVYLSGSGGKDYLEEDKFREAGIKLEYQKFEHPEYEQLHSSQEAGFEPYMSAVDLLFNEGPQSAGYFKV